MTHRPTIDSDTDASAWDKKAKAFVVRAHRHLWGKNNEDPLAYLFLRGLNNQFIKSRYLGWNKFGQERPYGTWGFKNRRREEKFILPPGIVIPYIKDKQLISVFIHAHFDSVPATKIVPGSRTPTLVLGDSSKQLFVIEDIMDGLLLFQEKADTANVVIITDRQAAIDATCQSLFKQADLVTLYIKDGNKQGPAFRQITSLCPARIVGYIDPSDLIG